MPDWQAIGARLADAGFPPRSTPRSVAGGDINAAWRVETDAGPVFLKTGSADALSMYSAELEALRELDAAGAVRVPRPLLAEAVGDSACLALEWLELEPADAAATAAFGSGLAKLHRVRAESFGWHRDNTIGSTPQPNTQSTDWVDFFRVRRLEHQLALAARAGFGGALQEQGAALAGRLPQLFEDYEPQPSLLHGDLWGGNWAACRGEPVMFDPASYYGDRETDLAMTRLFGGFGREFYAAYEQEWPLAPGADRRLPLYQLYHVLNHLNLFGRGYLGRAESLLATLNRQLDRDG